MEKKQSVKYRSTYVVDACNPPSLNTHNEITDHHIAIVLAVHRHKFLTIYQLARLLCSTPNQLQNLRRDLQALFHQRYIERIRWIDRDNPFIRKPSIYRDTNLGRRLLEARCGIAFVSVPSRKATHSDFLEHEIKASEFMVRLELQLRDKSDIPLRFHNQILAEAPERTRPVKLTWPVTFDWLSNRGEGIEETRSVEPDRPFAIDRHSGLFYEEDNGTETIDPQTYNLQKATVFKKLLLYSHTYLQRLHERYLGLTSFRVLIKTTTHERVEKAIEVYDRRIRTIDRRIKPGLFLFTDDETYRNHDILSIPWKTGSGKDVTLGP